MKFSNLSRREFIKLNAASLGMLSAAGFGPALAMTEAAQHQSSPLVDLDIKALISRSDLHYRIPVERSVEGLPIGNGVMGTMVWTTSSALHFQINRVDVYATNRNHMGKESFPRFTDQDTTDICGACAQVTIDLGGAPLAAGSSFRQDLSFYDAECRVQGDDVRARCFMSEDHDVMIVEIEDNRPIPSPIQVTLSLWGTPSMQRGNHLTRFEFSTGKSTVGELPVVTRTFTEGDYYCASGVAIQADVPMKKRRSYTQTEQTFILEPKSKKIRILVSSAGTMDPKADIVANTVAPIVAAAPQSTGALEQAHRNWWASFWGRTFVHLSSDTGAAEFMEQLRTVYLYAMAASCRGTLPPHYKGMIFNTEQDKRGFGAQFFIWGQEALVAPMFAADASDLLDSYFNMYVNMIPQSIMAAKQRWNANGMYVIETIPFDGQPTLPDDVAKEFRNVMLGTPPQPQPFSEHAMEWAEYDAAIFPFAMHTFTVGHYGQVSHNLASGPKLALQAWWRYRHTGDEAWLRSHAYPLMKNTIEFYRSLIKKGDDGLFHLYGSNVHESFLGVKDSIVDISAMKAVLPILLKASEMLRLDADLRLKWKEMLDKLAPFAMGRDPEAKALEGAVLGDDLWATGHRFDTPKGVRTDEDVWLIPVFPYEIYTLETPDPDMKRIVNKLFDLVPVRNELYNGKIIDKLNTAPRTPIAVARIGRGEELEKFLSHYYIGFPGRLSNGFSEFESPQGHTVEPIAIMAGAVQEGLLQSVSPSAGEPEVLRVFPACPPNWNATFSLLARGGFHVTSARRSGVIPFVEIESRLGGLCQFRNPWDADCYLEEEGKKKQSISGEILRFPTQARKRYRLYRDEIPTSMRVAPPAGSSPELKFTMENGTQITERLGRPNA
jgi:hypothetical protein